MNTFNIKRWISPTVLIHLAVMLCSLLFSGFALAQRDVMTLKRKSEIYYGQWYVLKSLPNTVFLLDKPNEADLELLRLLGEEDLTLEDGKLHPDTGSLHFISYTGLGFQKTIARIESEDTVILVISINEDIIKEAEGKPWYSSFLEKGKIRNGYISLFD